MNDDILNPQYTQDELAGDGAYLRLEQGQETSVVFMGKFLTHDTGKIYDETQGKFVTHDPAIHSKRSKKVYPIAVAIMRGDEWETRVFEMNTPTKNAYIKVHGKYGGAIFDVKREVDTKESKGQFTILPASSGHVLSEDDAAQICALPLPTLVHEQDEDEKKVPF